MTDRNLGVEASDVRPEQRAALVPSTPVTVWLTGLPASGKSTLARALERRLFELGRACYVLDGDNVRRGLSSDLGFSPADRRENIRRVAEVARLMNDAGLLVITAFISPYREDRETARRIVGEARFVEAFLSADRETCEARDPKGHWRMARAGRLSDFTGVSAPYETPQHPALVLDTGRTDVQGCVRTIVERILPAR